MSKVKFCNVFLGNFYRHFLLNSYFDLSNFLNLDYQWYSFFVKIEPCKEVILPDQGCEFFYYENLE